MLIVRLNNSGGELDRRTVETEDEAAKAAIDLIRDTGSLRDGDTITIVEVG